MDLAKRYKDSDGDNRTILQMVTLEKEWAANRIQEGEKALAKLGPSGHEALDRKGP